MYVYIMALLFFVLRGDLICFVFPFRGYSVIRFPPVPSVSILQQQVCTQTFVIQILLPFLSLLFLCSFPIAAKITRCGHVYCWSCVLHYLALVSNYHYRESILNHSSSCVSRERKNGESVLYAMSQYTSRIWKGTLCIYLSAWRNYPFM